MGVTLRDYRYVSFVELDWLKSGISNKRNPTRAAGNNMILDDMLRAGHDFVGNLCRWRRFRDPRRFRGYVEEHRPRQLHG
jgi:hypothetical protein